MSGEQCVSLPTTTSITSDMSSEMINRVIHEIEAMKERHGRELDAVLAELRACLPATEGAARYQRLRVIAGDRDRARAYLEGRG